MDAQDWQRLNIEAGRVFTPNAPIDERSLFAGRELQVNKVVDAIKQKGQHAILFGERGVGKTSLANVLSSFFALAGTSVLALRVNCDATDTFESVWRKVLAQIQLSKSVGKPGFNATPDKVAYDSTSLLGARIGPD